LHFKSFLIQNASIALTRQYLHAHRAGFSGQ
jgi:hypothetical protein